MTFAPSRTSAYDVKAVRRSVELEINADLLSRVEDLTPNLSATVEILLVGYIEEAGRLRQDRQTQLDCVIDALNLVHAHNGFLSDEFSKL